MDRIDIIDTLETTFCRLVQLHTLVDTLCIATAQTSVPADALFSVNDLLKTIYLKFRADIKAIADASGISVDLPK